MKEIIDQNQPAHAAPYDSFTQPLFCSQPLLLLLSQQLITTSAQQQPRDHIFMTRYGCLLSVVPY